MLKIIIIIKKKFFGEKFKGSKEFKYINIGCGRLRSSRLYHERPFIELIPALNRSHI